MTDHERRVHDRARMLWEEAGRPHSGIGAYLDQARELVAIEENQKLTQRPLHGSEKAGVEGDQVLSEEEAGPSGEPVEPIEALENEGEFPTLTDQGEEQIPARPRAAEPRRASKRKRAARSKPAVRTKSKRKTAKRKTAKAKSAQKKRTAKRGAKTRKSRKTASRKPSRKKSRTRRR